MPQEIRIQGDNLRVIEDKEQDALLHSYRWQRGVIQRYRLLAHWSKNTHEFNENVHKLLLWMRIHRRWLKSLTKEQRARITAEISTGNR